MSPPLYRLEQSRSEGGRKEATLRIDPNNQRLYLELVGGTRKGKKRRWAGGDFIDPTEFQR